MHIFTAEFSHPSNAQGDAFRTMLQANFSASINFSETSFPFSWALTFFTHVEFR